MVSMVKAITLIKRKPGMSVEDFQDYWLHRHPDAVLKLPGIVRYVQSHPLLGGYRKGELTWDGVAEVWFESMDVLKGNASSDAYKDVIADEEKFIDRSPMGLLLADEHVIKDGPVPADGVKNIEFVHRKPGMSVEDYQRYWREVHGPIAAEIPVIDRYVQSHAKPGAYRDGREPVHDGLAITWFRDVAAMRESATTPAYEKTVADEPNFIDGARLSFIICKEHVIKG